MNNEFNDLHEGVRLINTYKPTAMRVENNKFDGCKTGAFSLRADKSLIVDNEFIDCGIGSIIDASVGFKHTKISILVLRTP